MGKRLRSRGSTAAVLVAAVLGGSEARGEHDICGSARHEVELLKLGDGDKRKGAVIYYQRRLEADEKRLLPDDPELISDHEVLVRMLERAGQSAAAEALARKAAARAQTMPSSPRLGHALYELGAYFSHRGAFAEAEPLLARAVTCTDPASEGPLSPHLALEAHADALLALKRYPEARGQIERALALLKAKPRNDLSKAFLLRKLAKVLGDEGQLAAAEPALAEAAAEVGRRMGDSYWETGELLDDHAQLLRRLGRGADAAPLEARARKILDAAAKNPEMDADARKGWRSRVAQIDARRRQ